MANLNGILPLSILIDEQPCETHSTYSWAAGGTVLTISTVLPDGSLAVELVSSYVGHPRTGTIVTHLMLGPIGHQSEIRTVRHERLNPAEHARECAYDHAQQVIDQLQRAGGRQARVLIDELTFAQLESVH